MKTKIKLVIILLSVACAVFFAFRGQLAEAQTKTETAGQKFKNIKVLTDLPADQLGKVMNLFTADLGVDCSFCHEGENFEKDGKKPKDDARKMIKMTMAINKDNFNNRPQVTCNSCHNGHHEPQNVPNLNPVPEPERPAQPTTKPTVDQIVDKYITALGGAAKLSKITSRTIKASRIEPDGKTVEPETVWFKSGKYVASTTYGKIAVTEGYSGTEAWKRGENSFIDLKADEAEQIKREAELFSPANIKAIYPTMTYRLLDRIDGREVYVVTAATASNVRETLFFNVLSGLLVRRSTSTQTMFGIFVYQVDYADYKDFAGIKVPTTIRYSMPGIRWTRKILEVKNNGPVEDVRFAKP